MCYRARANACTLTPDASPPAKGEGAPLASDRAEAAAGVAAAGRTSGFDEPSFSGGCVTASDSAFALEAVAVDDASPPFSSVGELDADSAGAGVGTGAFASACAFARAAVAPSSFVVNQNAVQGRRVNRPHDRNVKRKMSVPHFIAALTSHATFDLFHPCLHKISSLKQLLTKNGTYYKSAGMSILTLPPSSTCVHCMRSTHGFRFPYYCTSYALCFRFGSSCSCSWRFSRRASLQVPPSSAGRQPLWRLPPSAPFHLPPLVSSCHCWNRRPPFCLSHRTYDHPAVLSCKLGVERAALQTGRNGWK